MKSSQSKTTSSNQPTGGVSESSSTSNRSRDDSSSAGSAAHASDVYSAGAGGDTSLSSASSAHGRDEFANIRSQAEQGVYSADERDTNARNQQSAQALQSSPYSQSAQQHGQSQYAQSQSPYGQQQDSSAQQRQPQATFRRRGQQQQQAGQFDQQSALSQRPSDLIAQSGLDAVMDAWAGLVLGQVQIATQAAIRLAQCWFAPSLISGISEVQRRYAEDSIASATAAASRLAQFTPNAINQNQPFFAQGNQQQGNPQNVQNAPYGQQQGQHDQQSQYGQSAQQGQQAYGQQAAYGQRQQQYA